MFSVLLKSILYRQYEYLVVNFFLKNINMITWITIVANYRCFLLVFAHAAEKFRIQKGAFRKLGLMLVIGGMVVYSLTFQLKVG